MKEKLIKLRRCNLQTTITIPKAFAEEGGFDEAKHALIKLSLDGTLTIRRVHVGEDNKRVV